MTLASFRLLSWLFVLVSLAAAAHADCPQSCVSYVCSTRAKADTTIHGGECSHHTGYDIPAGTLVAETWAGITFCWTGGSARLEDDFWIDGIPDGTPVSLIARFDFSARWQCGQCIGGGGSSAQITQGSSTVTWHAPDCNDEWPECVHQIDSVLTITVQATAGTPFRMRVDAWGAAGEAYTSMEGVISFDGAPAQAVIRSCNGFFQGIVATTPASWGSVRARYR